MSDEQEITVWPLLKFLLASLVPQLMEVQVPEVVVVVVDSARQEKVLPALPFPLSSCAHVLVARAEQ